MGEQNCCLNTCSYKHNHKVTITAVWYCIASGTKSDLKKTTLVLQYWYVLFTVVNYRWKTDLKK